MGVSVPDPAPAERAPLTPDDPPEQARPRERLSRRALTLSISMLVTAVLLTALALLPTSYVVRGAGPTFDTLGEIDDQPLITIEGAETFPASGQLRLTTVSGSGSPDNRLPLGRLVKAWLDPHEAVYPLEEVYPPGHTQEQIEEANRQQMLTSQETASVAALTELGYTVPATMTVVDTIEGTGAVGAVEAGDVVRSLDGEPMATYQELIAALEATEPGTVVDLGVERDGEDLTIPITTGTSEDGTAQLGVLLTFAFDFPVDVTMEIGNVGGSSAGMMFALGIIDLLTPEDEAGGQVIAGTGTMSVSGDVGAISGIEFKLQGAKRDGATWFLAPVANCDEVVGNVPDGLGVVAVETLDEAREAVVAIGSGETEGLPTCS